ncbi:MAG: alpha/beta fold hydrolase [Thermoanaerobaculia bacterium]|nr:alpha/beta fold hydrolase [Thermoanaerobaculia bacterium]
MPIRRALVACTLTLLASTAAAELPLAPCRLEGLDEEARCGTLAVPENRAAPGGRTLAIPVVVLPATGKATGDPIVYVPGGPGQSAIHGAAGMAHGFAALRGERDLLFVDTRGLGGDARLYCSELAERGNLQGFYDEFLPPDKVRRCRERLAARFDLTQFTTSAGVDDLEAVRRALGYEKLNLVGFSYGTRFALDFLRRHPGSARTATLVGIDPTTEHGPLNYARFAQNALDATFADCAAEPACAARFPDLPGDLARALARLDSGPVPVAIADPASGAAVPFEMNRAAFVQSLRYMLYLPPTALLVPLAVHEAGRGNFAPIAESAHTFFQFAATDFADGYYLATTCGEDVPYIDDAAIPAAVAGTFMGDFRIRQQRAACAAWVEMPRDPAFVRPVAADVPVLILSGERDPVTPAHLGEQAAATLPNALHVVLPDANHDYAGLLGADCPDRLAIDFVVAGTVRGLDTGCVAGMRRPPYVLAVPGADAPQLSRQQLARLAGEYSSPDGLAATVTLGDDGQLRVSLRGQAPQRLLPRSATRFGLAGMPSTFALEFRLDADGRATAFAVDEGAGPGLVLERRDGPPPAP